MKLKLTSLKLALRDEQEREEEEIMRKRAANLCRYAGREPC